MDTLTKSDVIIFNNLLDSLNMKNRITFSTHRYQHTLDLIIEDRSENLLYNLEKGHLFSGHNFINSTLDVREEVPPKKTLTYRNLKSINIKELAKDVIRTLDDLWYGLVWISTQLFKRGVSSKLYTIIEGEE